VSFVGRFALLAVFVLVSSVARAQVEPPPTTDQDAPHGKVLFNRNLDSPEVEKKAAAPVEQANVDVSDAERSSLTFTAYDLDVHLIPAASQLSAHTSFTVKNSGKEALKRLVFQISSSLHWESFGVQSDGRVLPLAFVAHVIDTDADHTGKATEAVVTLQQPLAPGAGLELTSFY
jgi:hypothetical protein